MHANRRIIRQKPRRLLQRPTAYLKTSRLAPKGTSWLSQKVRYDTSALDVRSGYAVCVLTPKSHHEHLRIVRSHFLVPLAFEAACLGVAFASAFPLFLPFLALSLLLPLQQPQQHTQQKIERDFLKQNHPM